VRSDILPCQSHGFRQTRCVKKTSSSTRRDPIERAINTDVVGPYTAGKLRWVTLAEKP
jgi:hypothetical protein